MGNIAHEKRVVSYMISLYCRKNHQSTSGVLCENCMELKLYAFERLSKCVFAENKPSCRECKIHCYKPELRTQIRTVMRYSGPKMIIYFPIDFIRHLIKSTYPFCAS